MLKKMHKLLFFILILFIFILRLILAPVFIVLKNFIPFLNKRINFERKNIFNQKSLSFKESNLKADYLFHVSSEGELEQSLPLIHYFISQNKLIELIFTSESVEKKIENLFSSYPKQLRIYRLPLLSFFPFNFLYFQSIFSFVTADKLVLCRYDFFPELLFFHFLNKKLILISGATKNWSWYKKYCFKLFDLIVASSEFERDQILNLAQKKSSSFDFRIPRIIERKNDIAKLVEARADFARLINIIEKNQFEEALLVGSMWPSDCSILKDEVLRTKLAEKKLQIFIAPHKLDLEFIKKLSSTLKEITGIESDLFDFESTEIKAPIVIVAIPGILCELYNYFPLVYVGGGFERSIHSVLEPYLMGAKVMIGPLIHRSTEYDFVNALSPNEILVLKNPESFYNFYSGLKAIKNDQDIRNQLSMKAEKTFRGLIKEIELL